MKGVAKTAAVALAAAVAGISSALAAPDRTTQQDTAKVPQISEGTGLSFEDLRVGPAGKVRVGIGATKAPGRMYADGTCDSAPRPLSTCR